MDIALIEHLANAASELEVARECFGAEGPTKIIWNRLLELQIAIEAIIRDEATS